MKTLNKFWFYFENAPAYSPLNLGCGVTALDFNDAMKILDEKVFLQDQNLKIKTVVYDVSIEELDANHVIPNMGVIVNRGVWFPLGY